MAQVLVLMFTCITAMLTFIDWRQIYFIYAILALIVLVWNYLIIPSLKQTIKIHTGSFNIRDISASTRIMIYGVIGFIPLLIYPKVESFENKLPEADYIHLQQQNAEVLNHENIDDTHDQYTHDQY